MTWYSNKLLAASGLEGNRITGFSNIMPFSYPRLIVLKAEEIAWYSNKPDRWFCAKVVLKTEEIARFSNKWRCKSVNEDVLKGGKLQGLKRVKNEISGYALELQINSNKKRILAEYGWVGGKELLRKEITRYSTVLKPIHRSKISACRFGRR